MELKHNNHSAVHIIDDDDAIRDSLSMLLQSEGLNTSTYESAQEFLKEYQTNLPGCIVLDISMQGMTGLELQNVLIEEKVLLPIIFITGHGDEVMHEQAMQGGAFDFIEKPFPVQTFLERVKMAIKTSENQLITVKEINV